MPSPWSMVQAGLVEPDAETYLRGQRQVGLPSGFCHQAAGIIRVLHQGESGARPPDGPIGTAHVEIDCVGPQIVKLVHSRDDVPVAGDKELIGQRPLSGRPHEVGGYPRVLGGQSPCKEHLRRQEPDPAEPQDDLPQGAVGKTRHGCLEEGRIELKTPDVDGGYRHAHSEKMSS